MTTKINYIAQARAANPKPQYRTENDVRIELNDDEYENSLLMWAEMKIQQEKIETEKQNIATAKTSACAKLVALGLSDDEIVALIGSQIPPEIN